MIFQPSCFILYFISPLNWLFSIKFSIMTSPRYYDVTHFLTDPNENCTAYAKLERNFVHVNFLISGIFIEKRTIYYEKSRL